MTIQINRGQSIAGMDAKALRDFLRKFYTGFDKDSMIRDLKLTARRAARVIRALLQEQYIEFDRTSTVRAESWYYVTKKGKELMRASAARRVTRGTARLALRAFMERVHEVNRDSRYLCKVTKVAVFGSFLKDVDRLGDVDVAVETDYRIPRNENLWKVVQEYARDSGRQFSTFLAEQAWPMREVKLALKARKRTLRIESWYSFTQMEKTSDFRYKVLLGGDKAIRRELEEAERERKENSTKNRLDG